MFSRAAQWDGLSAATSIAHTTIQNWMKASMGTLYLKATDSKGRKQAAPTFRLITGFIRCLIDLLPLDTSTPARAGCVLGPAQNALGWWKKLGRGSCPIRVTPGHLPHTAGWVQNLHRKSR